MKRENILGPCFQHPADLQTRPVARGQRTGEEKQDKTAIFFKATPRL